MSTSVEREVSSLAERYQGDLDTMLRSSVPESNTGFFSLLRYHLGWQDRDGNPVAEDSGKRLRPTLCLVSCEMLGGDSRLALPAAAALELVHNFSLLHDDIQDGDATRRGRPTAWTIFGADQALAAGNAMRVLAGQTLSSLATPGLSAESTIAASGELTKRYLEMIEGQYLDMSFETAHDVTTDQYLDMIGRKTGALIQAAMYLGSLIATNDQGIAQAFGICGRRLGLAFQIRDDLLGVWGDPAFTGKAVGADIQRKKKSMPIVFMFQAANASDRAWLEKVYSADEVGGPDTKRVLNFLDDLDVASYVQQTAQRQAEQAISAVSDLGLKPSAQRTIEAMAEYFVTRVK